MSQNFRLFLDQDFEKLKNEFKNSGKLFVDDKFPANKSSICKCRYFAESSIEWKRPNEIVQDPKFVVNKIEPNGLYQGKIGNDWFISALSCVLSSPDLVEKIIPKDQSFEPERYFGIFHFRFWVNGEWLDVVIDDFLPVNEDKQQLAFCKNNSEPKEMYGALLEKAFAKLNICYEFLNEGEPTYSLVGLTGGVCEDFDFEKYRSKKEEAQKLWELIFKSKKQNSQFITKKRQNDIFMAKEKFWKELIVEICYSVLDAFEIVESDGKFDTFRSLDFSKQQDKSIRLLK